jgi:SAM-dependent methyltransferase
MVGQDQDVLEIGCGNGVQMRALAGVNRRCVGIDISAEVLDHQADMPGNVELMIADATNLEVFAPDSFDVAFSSQLIEHLHPDDLPRHFAEVARVLRPRGRYVLETPHRLTGPHDVSRHFDDVATCFHLKEYFFGELLAMMRAAGFDSFCSPLFRNAMYECRPRLARLGEIPADWKRPFEAVVRHLPPSVRRRVAGTLRLNTILVEARLRSEQPTA